MSPQTIHLVGSVTPLLVIVLILAIRLPRMLKERRLRLETLWVRPALLVVVGALVIAPAPPRTLIEAAIVVAALTLGAMIGWWQGKMMAIGIEPESHQLNIKASPIAVILVVGLLILRVGLRMLVEDNAAWHVNIGLVIDSLIALVVGLYIAQALELYLRASAMLREARTQGVKPG